MFLKFCATLFFHARSVGATDQKEQCKAMRSDLHARMIHVDSKFPLVKYLENKLLDGEEVDGVVASTSEELVALRTARLLAKVSSRLPSLYLAISKCSVGVESKYEFVSLSNACKLYDELVLGVSEETERLMNVMLQRFKSESAIQVESDSGESPVQKVAKKNNVMRMFFLVCLAAMSSPFVSSSIESAAVVRHLNFARMDFNLIARQLDSVSYEVINFV